MAADKYLEIASSGRPKQKQAKDSSAGAGDAGKLVALNADGKIDATMLDGEHARSIVASENITAPKLVNIWDDSGTIKVRMADAANGRDANGFIKDNATASAAVNVYDDGVSTGWTGLTLGANYWLADGTPGTVTTTPTITGASKILQPVGKAVSATELQFSVMDYTELIA